MTKAELTNKLATQAEISPVVAEKAINTLTGIITDALHNGEPVRISGFGTFERRMRAARTGVNPQTREPIHIPEMPSAAFRAGAKLREAVRA